MKIVVLDGYTTNPGDLSWEPLEALGELTVYDRTPREMVVERAQGAEAVLTNKAVLDRQAIEALEHLQYIGVLATGVNVVDVEAAGERGITVSNARGYSTDSVAQMVFAHILNLCQHVAEHSHGVKQGQWAESRDFAYWDFPLVELAGLTLGIVGFGRIGRSVAHLGRAFGMNVMCYTRTPTESSEVRFVDQEHLFENADILSLHCPLTAETEGLVSAERLKHMKNTAFLINTGRGPLIDDEAVANALRNGEIAGAGIDVMQSEPPPKQNPLYDAPNCYITPHNAWATHASRKRLLDMVTDNLKAFQQGAPKNVVTP